MDLRGAVFTAPAATEDVVLSAPKCVMPIKGLLISPLKGASRLLPARESAVALTEVWATAGDLVGATFRLS